MSSQCRCPQCSALPLPTWTREHALLCEARMLAGLSLSARREYLDKPIVSGRRAALEAALKELWRERRPR